MWKLVVFAAGLLGACVDHAPTGALGVHWGEPAQPHCTGPRTQLADRFDQCDAGAIVQYGHRAQVTLVTDRATGALEGAHFAWPGADCDPRDLQAKIAAAFHTEYTAGSASSPYTVFGANEVVRYDGCKLVVGGPAYGKYYEGKLLEDGFANLAGSMLVH